MASYNDDTQPDIQHIDTVGSGMHPGVYVESRELIVGQPSAEEIRSWLLPAGLTDWQRSYERLVRIADLPGTRRAFATLLPYLLSMLTETGQPDRVLVNLERFLQSCAATGQRTAAMQVAYLSQNLRATEILTKLFSGSQFLTEILLRNPEYSDLLVEHRQLAQPKSIAQFCAELPTTKDCGSDYLDVLRRFQRRELLRIGTCDLLGLYDLSRVTAQLSNLADSLITACLNTSAAQINWTTDNTFERFVVLAIGKLGGQELNYSSDIDLLFLTERSTDRTRILGERLIESLTEVTQEGFLYRVDMRLRPWGSTGPLVTSFDTYLRYLKQHARIWEKQALLKARVIAGDTALGNAFLDALPDLIYEIGAAEAHKSVRTMKQLTESHLQQQGRLWGEVKLGEGSIRDVEFVTQYLQLIYGAQNPEIRSGTTLNALAHLTKAGLLPAQDSRILGDGYVFLRTIEHYLQMMHYRQTHTLPDTAQALTQLARRLGFEGPDAGDYFVARYEQHRAAIRSVYLSHLGEPAMNSDRPEPQATEADRMHVARMDASYATTFTESEIEYHAAMADRLSWDNLAEVEAILLTKGRWQVTTVAYDYQGELSLICGLLFVYGFTIDEGQVFTYEPDDTPEYGLSSRLRKIVDTFIVRAVRGTPTMETWQAYEAELEALLRLMQAGKGQEARGKLAKRAASVLPSSSENNTVLYPVNIAIDNESSANYTVLNISAPDTLGFLYEITNALAYNHIYIARVSVSSLGDRAQDVLFVTDANGHKIASPKMERELRAAVVLIKHFTHLLPHTPDPETALLHFREFISHLFRQPNWPDELASLESSEVLYALARLLGVSEFLWDDFLRMQYANLFPVVRDMDVLDTMKSRDQLQIELESALARVHNGPQPTVDNITWRKEINAFKDREMFRIDMRHILGHTKEFRDFSEELTALTEVIVNATYHLCHEDLRAQYGTPHLTTGELSDMTVCALGKCGGRELGFASDIELLFVYSGNGETAGPSVISTAEFYEKLVQLFLQVIEAKREGIFEIDLQLRPYGKAGSMAVSLESFRRYFAPDGPAWAYERQALVKLRPIAGNSQLGQMLVQMRDYFVYDHNSFDVAAMKAMRERQIRHLVTGGTFNAKYSPGALVDIEYLIQGLQIVHGGQHLALRSTNIREAMAKLAEIGLLNEQDYARLRRAHTFLRWLIDGLRMVRGNARDLTVPPSDSEAFAFLARRLHYDDNIEQLQEDLVQHTTAVQELNRKLLT